MGQRRQDKPEEFGDGTWSTDEGPVDPRVVEDAVARFVGVFVVKSKQERMRVLLLHEGRQRRIEGIQTLYKWLHPETTTVVGGNTGFPHQLEKRFGAVRGILIRENGTLRVGAPHASFLAAGGFGAVFLADDARMALLFPEIGPPTLALEP